MRSSRRDLPAFAADSEAVLCDAACTKELETKELITLPSGLQYRDLKEGKGPMPPTGYQASA